MDSAETHASKVIGKVLFTVPYAGFILDFARQPIGFALLIGVPAALIMLEGVFSIVREVGAIRRRRRGDVEDNTDGAHGAEEIVDFMELEAEEAQEVADAREMQATAPQYIVSPVIRSFDGIQPWRKS